MIPIYPHLFWVLSGLFLSSFLSPGPLEACPFHSFLCSGFTDRIYNFSESFPTFYTFYQAKPALKTVTVQEHWKVHDSKFQYLINHRLYNNASIEDSDQELYFHETSHHIFIYVSPYSPSYICWPPVKPFSSFTFPYGGWYQARPPTSAATTE